MTNKEVLYLAEKFLKDRGADIVVPGKIGRDQNYRIEAIFLRTLALQPGVVIDPPDLRVWVDTKTEKIELIYLV